MKITVYTDGGALGNPGPSAAGYAILNGDRSLYEGGKYLGEGTNNNAEYTAVVLALYKIQEMIQNGKIANISGVNFISDSNLLVNQLNGMYKVKNAAIREHIAVIRNLEATLNVPVTYTHVYRENNTLADSLVKKALQDRN